MGAIDDDLQPVEPKAAREGVLDELDIAAAGVIQAAGASESGRLDKASPERIVQARFDLTLDLVRQLVAIGAEA